MTTLEILLVSLIGGGLGAYLGAYLREKGKNLATREDVDRLVHATEQIKAEIAGGLWVEQNRWTFRAAAYEELLESLAELTSAIRQVMFARESRPKVEGDSSAEKFLDDMQTEYGQRGGAAFERLVRATSVAGVWLAEPARRALEDLNTAWREAQTDRPVSIVFAAKVHGAARKAMGELTAAARDDLQLPKGNTR